MSNDLTMTGAGFGAGKFNTELTAGSAAVTGAYPAGSTYTFDCWITNTQGGDHNRVLFSIASGPVIYMDPNGRMQKFMPAGGGTSDTAAPLVNDGALHHLRVVGDGTNEKVYLAGNLILSSPVYTLTAGQLFTIGRHQNFTGFDWGGSIDEFSVWNIALNTGNFTPPTASFASGTAGLVALYHFDGNGQDNATVIAAPDAPTIGTVTPGENQVIANFTPAATGGAAASFIATWTPSTGNAVTATGTASPITIPGLVGGVSGRAHVVAINTTNSSAPSAESASVTPTVANIISITDANVYWSPFVWDNRGPYKVSACVGAYAKIAYAGTRLSVNLDNSVLISSGLPAASWPRIRIIYDGVTVVDTQITSSMSAITRNGQASGNHTAEIYLDAMDDNNGDLWNAPTNALRITGFTLDNSAAVSAWSPFGKTAIAYGDSTARGYLGLSISNSMPAGNSNAVTVFPLIAKARRCELGIAAYSGQGYETSGGNTPPFPTAYDSFSAGRSRLVNGLLVPQPDEVYIMHGTNGQTTQADVQGGFTKVRAAAPNALIFAFVPLGGYARAAITAAVAAQGDAKIYLIDLPADYAVGINNYTQVQNYWSWDGLHPNERKNAACAAAMVGVMQTKVDGVVVPSLTTRTASFTMRNAAGPMSNLTALQVTIYDDPLRRMGSPARYWSNVQTTDTNGICTIPFQSTLAAGGKCGIDVLLADGTNMAINPTVA